MKRLSALLLSLLLLLALAACGTPTLESPTPPPPPPPNGNLDPPYPGPPQPPPQELLLLCRRLFPGQLVRRPVALRLRGRLHPGGTVWPGLPGHLGRVPWGGALFRCLGQQTVYRGRHTTASALWRHRGARLHYGPTCPAHRGSGSNPGSHLWVLRPVRRPGPADGVQRSADHSHLFHRSGS